MADGFARVSGRHGVVIGQNGPGISNCVTAVAAAYWAHSPVVMITPEAGTMGMGLGGFQEANQLPMFQEFTKYQGHVANEHRMAEITARCFDRAMSEIGPDPAQHPPRSLLRRHRCRDPAADASRPGSGRRAVPRCGGHDARRSRVPRDDQRRGSGDGRRDGRGDRARRAPRLPGDQQLPAQRLVPRVAPAVVRPDRLPGLEGRDEAAREGRRRPRPRHATRTVRHAPAARPHLLARGRQDHPGRRRLPRCSAS